eukprot:TRINITY_DN2161_c0_g1_i1.p1 TRINITY_DN2161_c0_g1~~TRINITY_DN2161_c0_g1_i1.p1  ORF type:complete len:440 (+),score=89.68 TRINITY_DN2161_c0_g1_i1:48-1367(+)
MTASSTPSSPCHYTTLGIAKSAQAKEIKAAYRRRALECHPDKNPNGGKEFQRLHRAYETLIDPQLRRDYDNQQEAKLNPPQRRQPHTARTAADSAFQQRYAHYDAHYDHHSTNQFVQNLMKHDKEMERRKQEFAAANGATYHQHAHKPTAQPPGAGTAGTAGGTTDFAQWYKQKQNEWRQAEKAAENANLKREESERMMRAESDLRAQRLRDIEQDLERDKQADVRRRQREEDEERARRAAFEIKRQAALQEIEREEERYQQKFAKLKDKWADTQRNLNTGAATPRETPANVKPQTPAPENVTEEAAVEEALREVRQQREALRRERERMREEEAEARRQVQAVKTGEFADSLRDNGEDGPILPGMGGMRRAGSIFGWNEPQRENAGDGSPIADAMTAAELRAALAELEAEVQDDVESPVAPTADALNMGFMHTTILESY